MRKGPPLTGVSSPASTEFQPRFDEWETLTGAEIGAGNREWERMWDAFRFGIDDEFRREEMLLSHIPV
jgi:hypothetical protein